MSVCPVVKHKHPPIKHHLYSELFGGGIMWNSIFTTRCIETVMSELCACRLSICHHVCKQTGAAAGGKDAPITAPTPHILCRKSCVRPCRLPMTLSLGPSLFFFLFYCPFAQRASICASPSKQEIYQHKSPHSKPGQGLVVQRQASGVRFVKSIWSIGVNPLMNWLHSFSLALSGLQ